MGEHSRQRTTNRQRSGRNQRRKQAAEELGRRLLEIIVYDRNCRVGSQTSLDGLEATEIGDWTMTNFKAACAYSVSQGWLVVQSDVLVLTTAGLAAA